MTEVIYVGMDENGYGPKMGPLLVSSVAISSPSLPEDTLRGYSSIRRYVHDSKQVFRSRGDIREGEIIALALIYLKLGQIPKTFHELLRAISLRAKAVPKRTCSSMSCMPDVDIPIAANVDEILKLGEAIGEALNTIKATLLDVRSLLLCPWQFNTMLKNTPSKSTLNFNLFRLHWNHYEELALSRDAKLEVISDKLGGTKRYTPLLRGWYLVSKEKEEGNLSSYLLRGKLSFRVRFHTRGDELYWLIGIASIVGKYLRELSMMSLSNFLSELLGSQVNISGYHDKYTMEVLAKLESASSELPLECLIRKR